MPARSRAGRLTANQQLDQAFNNGLVILIASIAASANATAVTVEVPFDIEIVDVVVQARATSGGGTATVRTGTNAITNAIAMATDTNITRAGTIDDSRSTILQGGSLNVITAGANDRGLVSILARRI